MGVYLLKQIMPTHMPLPGSGFSLGTNSGLGPEGRSLHSSHPLQTGLMSDIYGWSCIPFGSRGRIINARPVIIEVHTPCELPLTRPRKVVVRIRTGIQWVLFHLRYGFMRAPTPREAESSDDKGVAPGDGHPYPSFGIGGETIARAGRRKRRGVR